MLQEEPLEGNSHAIFLLRIRMAISMGRARYRSPVGGRSA